jgi:uncharacterized lipoprotein YehR (DUF1307 family)
MQYLLKTILVASLLTVGLAGCSREPVNRQATDNSNIEVDRLFTKDGCTVYRFYDNRSVYFVKCNGGDSQTQYSYSCGKNCITTDNVATANV